MFGITTEKYLMCIITKMLRGIMSDDFKMSLNSIQVPGYRGDAAELGHWLQCPRQKRSTFS